MNERMYYLDWLRVFAVILLFPFHAGMMFTPWAWMIKNSTASTAITVMNGFIDVWHMPLFFLIAGASTWFALGRRSAGDYIREREKRLLRPLLFGTLLIIPPQTYLERLQQSGFSGSYLDFYPQVFNGFYPRGNFTWMHLWFLAYLFIISIIVLPLLLKWKQDGGLLRLKKIFFWLVQGRKIFLLAVPLAIIQVSLEPAFPGPQNIVHDWNRLLFMLVIFSYGALLFAVPELMESVERNKWVALTAGIVVFIAFFLRFILGGDLVRGYNMPWLVHIAVRSFFTLCWLIVFAGFARGRLNVKNRFLDYASQAALPVYILHQTVIVIIGFYIVSTDFSISAKFSLTVVGSFIITLAIYELVVKRFSLMRMLFGMRPKSAASQQKGPEKTA